jgi:hypothetical protein
MDPDDDALVTLTDLRKFLEANNINNSLVEAKYLIEEANERGKLFQNNGDVLAYIDQLISFDQLSQRTANNFLQKIICSSGWIAGKTKGSCRF